MDRFGWTPRQIETLTDFEYEALLSTIDTLSAIEKAEREKQSAKNGNGRVRTN
jgi:hypothetical protein